MVTNDATILHVKHEVLYEVAKLAWAGELEEKRDYLPYKTVSYTHLDVYKRQARACGMDGYCFADGDVGKLKRRLEEVTGRKLTGPQ